MSYLDDINLRLAKKQAVFDIWRKTLDLAHKQQLLDKAAGVEGRTTGVKLPNTVHDGLESIMGKWGFSRKCEAAEFAVRVGVIFVLEGRPDLPKTEGERR